MIKEIFEQFFRRKTYQVSIESELQRPKVITPQCKCADLALHLL